MVPQTGELLDLPRYCILLNLRKISIGRTEVSCSKTLVLVELYAPVTSFKHFPCMLLSGLMIRSGIFSPFPAPAHTGDPYIRDGLTIVQYNSLALWKVAPHVDCTNLLIDWVWITAFCWTVLMWAPQFSLGSKQTPRTRRDDCGDVKCPWIVMVAVRSCRFLAREKCINWYFSGANLTPCFLAQSSQIRCCSSSFLQFSSVELAQVSMLVSSTKPTAIEFGVCSIGRSVLTKNRKSMGEREEPWGIPVLVGIWLPLNDPRIIDVDLSFKNDSMNLVIHFGIPFSLRLWISLSWGTLSNAPEMSRLSRDATRFLSFPQIVWICSVSSSIAEIVDLWGRAPICSSGRSSCSSAALEILLATNFSRVFPIVFRSAMGRYAFAKSCTTFHECFVTF